MTRLGLKRSVPRIDLLMAIRGIFVCLVLARILFATLQSSCVALVKAVDLSNPLC